MTWPLRPSRVWVAFFGALLFALAVLPALVLYPADWQRFLAGGATVGTPVLMDVQKHVAFQVAHGLETGAWTYPPAFAWFFLPAAHVPMAVGYALNLVLTTCLAGMSGWILAGAFGFARSFGLLAALAWEPAIYSGDVGQVSSIWLFLIAIAIVGAQRRSPWLLGGAIGLLLLKPSIALPFVALLFVRRDWKTLGTVAICGALWYSASVAATSGDWIWMPQYAGILHSLYQTDLGAIYNGMTLPAILIRLGAPAGVGLALVTVNPWRYCRRYRERISYRR